MKKTVLKVENLSKIYRLGQVGTGTISHDLNRWWSKIRNKQDPYAKIAQTNMRSHLQSSDYFYALKEIDFEVNKGDVVGIIGKNGAGKSTLLKVMSQITIPSSGSIKAKGRISSLLEVGTGMHPEMTARENIFLNGMILGMKKSEIKLRFDDIIDFSGCKMYVDTPVKRFSTGMRVRLGFSVAAFLDPDILIVDEVLAVGDADFQKQAIKRIGDINTNKGKTILFVSHNLASVKNICNRGVVLNTGELIYDGNVSDAISCYTNTFSKKIDNTKFDKYSNDFIKLNEISVNSDNELIITHDEILFQVNFQNLTSKADLLIRFDIYNLFNVHIIREEIKLNNSGFSKKGNYKVRIKLPPGFLNKGRYILNIDFIDFQKRSLLNCLNCMSFEIHSDKSDQNISKRDISNAISTLELEKEIELVAS